MASYSPKNEYQVQKNENKHHDGSSSCSRDGDPAPAYVDPSPTPRGGNHENLPPLAQSQKHVHDDKPQLEPPGKRAKLKIDGSAIARTISTNNSGFADELTKLRAEIASLRSTESRLKQKLDECQQGLRVERRTQENTKSVLVSIDKGHKESEAELRQLRLQIPSSPKMREEIQQEAGRDKPQETQQFESHVRQETQLGIHETDKAPESQLQANLQESEVTTCVKAGIQEDLQVMNVKKNKIEQDLTVDQGILTMCGTEPQCYGEQGQQVRHEQQDPEKVRQAYLLVHNEDYRKMFELEAKIEKDEKRHKARLSDSKAAEKAHLQEKVQLAAKIETLKTENMTLQADLELQVEEVNQVRTGLLKELQDCQGLSQRYNYKVSDDNIAGCFGDLKHKIAQFANKYTRSISESNLELQDFWLTMSPNFSSFSGSPLLSVFAFEARFWEWLRLFIFKLHSSLWAGELGIHLDWLAEKVEIQLHGVDDEFAPEYHSWRATSSNFLSRLSERSFNRETYETPIKHLVKDLTRIFGRTFDTDAASNEFRVIVNDARDLEIMRRKLKSNVNICFEARDAAGKLLSDSIPVDDSTMRRRGPRVETTLACPEPMVQLIVSPSVIRWGDSDGLGYGISKCLVKMDVLYSHTPAKVASEAATKTELTSKNLPACEASLPAQAKGFPGDSKTAHGRQRDKSSSRSMGCDPPNQSARRVSASAGPSTRTRPPRAAAEQVRLNAYRALNSTHIEDDGRPHSYPENYADDMV